jgi:hypothetical protein
LYCPACEYALTGLEERRCPECGGTFDPANLRILADRALRHAEPFSSTWKRYGVFVAWGRTVGAVLFTPVQFARQFPRNCALTDPILFYLISVGFSFFGPALAYLLGAVALNPLMLSITVSLTILPSAALLASICRVSCRTRKFNPVDGWRTWFGLILFSSCHAVSLGIIGGLELAVLELITRADNATLETAFAVGFLMILIMAAVLVVWWIQVSVLIGAARCRAFPAAGIRVVLTGRVISLARVVCAGASRRVV